MFSHFSVDYELFEFRPPNMSDWKKGLLVWGKGGVISWILGGWGGSHPSFKGR